MITDVNMDRFLIFLLVHDDSLADHEACSHCNEDVTPAVQSLVEDLIVFCNKKENSFKDIENTQWSSIDPLLALKNFNPTVHFSIIEDKPFLDQMEIYSKWYKEENLQEVLQQLEKSVVFKHYEKITVSSSDKDVEISERLHSLADGLPLVGVPVDVFWFICGRDALPVRSHMHLFGALKRLQLWHNANITVLCSNVFDRSSFLKSWRKGLKLSVTFLDKKDAVPKMYDALVVWQGSLVFSEGQSRTIMPGFNLRFDKNETEISFSSSRLQPKRKKKNPLDTGKTLSIAPEITILCRVEKHTVPFHMFLPVRLGLSVNQSSTKLSARLIEWLSVEENKNIALVGTLQLVASYKHCTQRKNKEAWFNYVKSQNHTVTNRLDVNSGDEDLKESCRRVCLICGSNEKELSLYVLRRPEDLNGWIHKELSLIQSSFLISNDKKVGGPLTFPDLTESFIETEQNLTEVLLQELHNELQTSDDLFLTNQGCNIVAKTTSTKWQFLKEKRPGWKDHQLEAVDKNVLPPGIPELSLSPSKWPERAWLFKNDPNARRINDSVTDESTKHFQPFTSVSSLSIQDILEKFRKDGTPVRSDLVPLQLRERSSSDRHMQIDRGSTEEVREKFFPEALGASYHGIEYCLDVRQAISKDLQLSHLQSSLVKNETLSSCLQTDHKTLETRGTRAVTSTAKRDKKSSVMKLSLPVSRTVTVRKRKETAASIGSSSRLLKKKSPLVKAPTVGKKRKREEEKVRESKGSDKTEVKMKETRSERHKRRLRQVVQNTLEDNGIDSSHPFRESCTGRLYSLCKSFLKDLRSSHGLNDEMKRLAKSNVQQVIEFETKRK